MTALLNAFKTRGMSYQLAKVKFETEDGVPGMVEFNIATGSAEQERFVQSYFVDGIDPPMNDSCEKLADFLTARMAKRVAGDRT